MSLPPLLKHVYNYGSEEVVRRGKKIFLSSGVSLMDVDHLIEQVRFRVRNDLYQNYYTVTITKYLDPDKLTVRCQCPYNMGDICRHEVAALFQLNELVQSGVFANTDVVYDQKHTIVRLRNVSENALRIFTHPHTMEVAKQMADAKKAIILSNQNDKVEAEVPDGDNTFTVVLKQNDERYFDTSCGCNEQEHPLCVHKTAVFLQLLYTFGPQYFRTLRNWDEQKNMLLQQYGYSLKDDLTDKFAFTYEGGKPFLRVLDPSIKKVNQPTQPTPQPTIETAVHQSQDDGKHLGIVLDTHASWFPFVQVMLVAGQTDDDVRKFVAPIEKLELGQYINPMRFKDNERDLLPVVRKFSPDEMMKYLRKNLPFGDFLDDYTNVLKEEPADEVREQVWEYLVPKYQKLMERYSDYHLCFLHQKGKTLSGSSLQPVIFAEKPTHPQVQVRKKDDGYHIILNWEIEGSLVAWKKVTVFNPALILHDNHLYAISSVPEVQIAQQFMPSGEMIIGEKEWPAFLEKTMMQWSEKLHVDFSDELIEQVEKTKPVCNLFLTEREQMLIFQPIFNYNGVEVKWGFLGDVILPHDGIVKIVSRNEAAEHEFIQMFRNLHSEMKLNQKEHFFYLTSQQVLANNWFFHFTDTMREWNVSIYGFEGLKNLRINAHRPDTRVQVSSGIDWFDASVEIVFGDQKVTIADVKKALAQKVNYVKLGDGTLGLLPEEWLKKYALLVKMGDAKGGKLRINKLHFSVLDELLAEVDENTVLAELEEKKERLADIISSDFSSISPSEHLSANLRPYQIAGFQWLVFLNEAGWGGLLADDMGLGKTVQTLSFLQHYKDKNPDAKFLVVCPTTLMYNWENEMRKFTPTLRHFIYHGPKRNSKLLFQDDYDVVVTTYGTMRSDIKFFKEIKFDYIVLDESQAIKNPQSQVAKAALLLNAKNRLALSGTPVQNNTFDLYAQMNFLNPGMLGSREFFMNEFATPIDKFQEGEVKQQLRKLIYPFLLRRTKEQVAKDLPEKTETMLFCEMGNEQRKIYDAYRNDYKDRILGLIDEQGIERSQMHILQGLTKLRQICDSPAILNEDEKFANHSIKIDELMREIEENVGDHKALIFSQFLGMLGLIRAELEKKGIPYAYFDGSTSSGDREKAINEFQNNHNCRVFLISLKAGGVGLNLTAADYVYIVDPWWNPAVEQQAIDRTHRIGQTKNIFAYRLICKDTIEEKMMLLQERKRALASELVSDDSGILKRLTREDIAYLFS